MLVRRQGRTSDIAMSGGVSPDRRVVFDQARVIVDVVP